MHRVSAQVIVFPAKQSSLWEQGMARGWPFQCRTYCPPRPLDGLPHLEVADNPDWRERDRKLARKIQLWTIGAAIGWGLAYLMHGVFG